MTNREYVMLEDKNGKEVLPVTDGNGVFVEGGTKKLDKKLTEINEQLEHKANKYDVRKSTSVQPINVSEMDTETKKLFTGGAVAVVGENAIGSENIKTNAVLNSKLEMKTGAIVKSLSENVNLIENEINFEFEHGSVNSDGSLTSNPQYILNNIRTVKKYNTKYTKITLLTDNVMVKVMYYNSDGSYKKNSGWLSKEPTEFSSGGTVEYTINNSNVIICLADTTRNNLEQYTITVEELLDRVNIEISKDVEINGGFINNKHIIPKSLDKSVFKDGVLDDIIKDNTTIIDGVMNLPSEFGTLPFDILKEDKRYNISLSDKQLNINPITVYVSDDAVSTGLGTDKAQPINLKQVKQNFISNLYPSKNIKIKFVDNLYFMSAKSDFDLIGTGQDNIVTNLTIESDYGFTWIGYGKKNVNWTNYSGNANLYVTTESKKISDLADVENLKNNGLPSLYIKKTSLSGVTKEGEFCQVGDKVYVYPYATNDINKINLIYGFDYSTDKTIPGIITVRKNSKGNIIFKNIGTFLDCLNLRDLKSLDVWYYFFNCRFHRDSMDSLALDGKYKAVLVDCIADYASKDNFNYHSTSKDSVAIELNCKSYGAGQYKLDTNGVNTTKDSCNGSTAHNGMCVARFGCSYWDCEGSVVADVNNCVTYCVDCSVKNILPTISNANYKASYMLHDNRFSSIIYRPDDNHKNYLINCVGGGENVTWGVRSEGMKIDIANFKGNTTNYQEGTSDINNIQTII